MIADTELESISGQMMRKASAKPPRRECLPGMDMVTGRVGARGLCLALYRRHPAGGFGVVVGSGGSSEFCEQGGVFVAMAPFAVGVEILGLTYRVRRCIILIIIFIDNTKWNYFPLWRHHDGH